MSAFDSVLIQIWTIVTQSLFLLPIKVVSIISIINYSSISKLSSWKRKYLHFCHWIHFPLFPLLNTVSCYSLTIWSICQKLSAVYFNFEDNFYDLPKKRNLYLLYSKRGKNPSCLATCIFIKSLKIYIKAIDFVKLYKRWVPDLSSHIHWKQSSWHGVSSMSTKLILS